MPFPGSTFKVTASELAQGLGTITVLENGFLFEANNHRDVGFDFSAVRLVRRTDIDGFDVAYSLQGSIQKTSFVTTPRYIRKNEGIDKDVTTNPVGWPMDFWKLHTITGAVTARILTDRSGSQSEGLSLIPDVEFEPQFRDASDAIQKLPPQKEIEGTKVDRRELDLRERKLADTFLKLSDAWLMGNLSPQQREKVAALNYLSNLKRHELGWFHSSTSDLYSEMTNQDYKENAEDWFTEEMKWGSNLREIFSPRF